jgi:hypothetical protein
MIPGGTGGWEGITSWSGKRGSNPDIHFGKKRRRFGMFRDDCGSMI